MRLTILALLSFALLGLNSCDVDQTEEGEMPDVDVRLIILTIIFPPLGVGLDVGISSPFWICLVLTLLFYLPGLIYGLWVVL